MPCTFYSPQICIILKTSKISVSFEFFPPNNGNFARVGDNLDKLLKFEPRFISVTFGAGGSAENKSVELIEELSSRSATEIVAHLTLVDKTKDRIAWIAQQFRLLGIKTILAVRGDSSDKKYESTEDGLSFRRVRGVATKLHRLGLDSIAVRAMECTSADARVREDEHEVST